MRIGRMTNDPVADCKGTGQAEQSRQPHVSQRMCEPMGDLVIMSKAFVLSCAMLVALAGCGRTFGEQALFGAGAGVAGAAVVGGDPLAGAAVGAGGNILFCQANPGRC